MATPLVFVQVQDGSGLELISPSCDRTNPTSPACVVMHDAVPCPEFRSDFRCVPLTSESFQAYLQREWQRTNERMEGFGKTTELRTCLKDLRR